MIPIMQKELKHDPDNGEYGDCFSAFLASVLHLPIEDVPMFCHKPEWRRNLNEWLKPRGLAFLTVRLGEDQSWASLGITGMYCEVSGELVKDSGILHSTVGIDGITVHDPHPLSTGLSTVQDEVGVFIALEPWKYSHLLSKEPTND